MKGRCSAHYSVASILQFISTLMLAEKAAMSPQGGRACGSGDRSFGLFYGPWIALLSMCFSVSCEEAQEDSSDASGSDPRRESPGPTQDWLPAGDSGDIFDNSTGNGDGSEECVWAGCLDGCCECENGGVVGCGGCWTTCEEPPLCNCSARCPEYTCETAHFIEPVTMGERSGLCSGALPGRNSFWYRGEIATDPEGPGPPGDCPTENPCCQRRFYTLGFRDVRNPYTTFYPIDTSEIAGLDWSCSGTNCGPECNPPVGTVVDVHLRWFPDVLSLPSRLIPEEVCAVHLDE